MSETINRYAPPKAQVGDLVHPSGEAEAIRLDHIRREAEIRSVGALYYIGGALVSLGGVGMLTGSIYPNNPRVPLLGGVYLVMGLLSFFVGRGIRDLRPWARTAMIVLAVIGLLGFPVGTLINAYILYLALSAKGKRIFESDYREIIAATPDVKYRTSVVTWIAIGLLILLLAALVMFAAARRFH
jgi:hypothetical protein